MISKIVTHNGAWHADEVLAIALIHLVASKDSLKEFELIRTRDVEVLSKAKQAKDTFVLDVGAEYDPENLNFDHHQRDFKKLNSFGNPMSTFGLIVEYLLHEIPQEIHQDLLAFADKVDCQDNGIQASPELFWIAELNELEDFEVAITFSMTWLQAKFKAWFKNAEQIKITLECIEKSENGIVASEHNSLRVGLLLNQHEHLKLIVSPSSSGGYSIQSLNVGIERDFSVRCPTPESWRGLRDQELKDVSGFEGIIFSHSTGFLTVADTYENAMKIANYLVSVNK